MAKISIVTGTNTIERNMEHIVFHIASHLDDANDITLVGAYNTSSRIRERFRVHAPGQPPTSLPGLGLAAKTRLVLQYAKAHKPDILMAVSGIGSNGLATALAGRLLHIPTIVRVTSDIFVIHKYQRPRKKQLRLFFKNNVAGRLAMRLADRVILLHEAQREQLVAMGYPTDKFYVVPQPIIFPERPTSLTRATARQRLGLPPEAFVFGYFGRIAWDKNIPLMAATAVKVLAQRPGAHFLVVGKGNKQAALEQALTGLPSTFAGQVPHAQLPAYFLACDATLHTSFSEGLSNVMAESLYFGIPVISTDSGLITRSLVTNIGHNAEELASLLCSDDLILDQFPKEFDPRINRQHWLGAVQGLPRQKR